MKSKFLKIIIVILIFIGVLLISNKVNASSDNYNKIKAERSFAREYIIGNNGTAANVPSDTILDITSQLTEALEDIKGKSDYSLVYIPSGTYYIGDDNNLVLHSNMYLVAENDTNIIKTVELLLNKKIYTDSFLQI